MFTCLHKLFDDRRGSQAPRLVMSGSGKDTMGTCHSKGRLECKYVCIYNKQLFKIRSINNNEIVH